jgi:hypothetical protein
MRAYTVPTKGQRIASRKNNKIKYKQIGAYTVSSRARGETAPSPIHPCWFAFLLLGCLSYLIVGILGLVLVFCGFLYACILEFLLGQISVTGLLVCLKCWYGCWFSYWVVIIPVVEMLVFLSSILGTALNC